MLYHLTEGPVFFDTLHTLFRWARRFVVIYASNVDAAWTSAHVARAEPDWRLLAHLPNPPPFDPARPDETSFADFFIFARTTEMALIPVPAAAA